MTIPRLMAKDLVWEDVSCVEDCGEFVDYLSEGTEIAVYELTDNFAIKKLATKVRAVVAIFRKSPLKNEVLQRRVVEKQTKNLTVLNDCKTRWNSTLTMFERFLKLKESIGLALIDLGGEISFQNAEWELLSDMINCLKLVEIAVKELCGAHVNLLQADIIVTELLKKMEKLILHPFCEKMYSTLVTRINERRNINSIVLGYLEYGRINPNVHHTMSQFSSISDKELINFLEKFYKRATTAAPLMKVLRKGIPKRYMLLMTMRLKKKILILQFF